MRKHFKISQKNRGTGFTLVELLVVVALVAVVAGVSADIIFSLVRSNAKTKITNELEQSANSALLKIEKELKSATQLVAPAQGTTGSTLRFVREINGTDVGVQYVVTAGSGGKITRSECNVTFSLCSSAADVLSEIPTGVEIINASIFQSLDQNNPNAVRIIVQFQSSATGNTAFEGVLTVEQTLTLRGTYR